MGILFSEVYGMDYFTENTNLPIGFSVSMIRDIEDMNAKGVVNARTHQNVVNKARNVVPKDEKETIIEQKGTFPL